MGELFLGENGGWGGNGVVIVENIVYFGHVFGGEG